LGHEALLCYHNDPIRENLDISIRHFEHAQEICPFDHGCRVIVLRNLAMAKFLDFQVSRTYASLEAAISLSREALKLLSPSDYFNRPQRMHNLALMLLRWFELHGELHALERSIVVHKEAIRLAPAGHPNHPRMFASLGVSFLCRFERVCDITDLKRSMSTGEAALQWTPQSHADRPWILANL
ncbi:hypothetical protein OG21DRAFT_1378300, partial [Imleria badia]